MIYFEGEKKRCELRQINTTQAVLKYVSKQIHRRLEGKDPQTKASNYP